MLKVAAGVKWAHYWAVGGDVELFNSPALHGLIHGWRGVAVVGGALGLEFLYKAIVVV